MIPIRYIGFLLVFPPLSLSKCSWETNRVTSCAGKLPCSLSYYFYGAQAFSFVKTIPVGIEPMYVSVLPYFFRNKNMHQKCAKNGLNLGVLTCHVCVTPGIYESKGMKKMKNCPSVGLSHFPSIQGKCTKSFNSIGNCKVC